MPEPRAELVAWARRHWPGGDPGPPRVEPIRPDGSQRLFLRLQAGGRSLVLMANPDNPPENRAWYHLARVLAGLDLPVARVLAADQERGRFLMEDLGGVSLQEAARARDGDHEALERLYRPVLVLLARMQARAGELVDTSLCFDGAELTPEFLRRREAGYFLEEFVAGACGLEQGSWPAGLEEELDHVCQRAGRARPRGFVHRDFQSRNILVRPDGGLGLVDFQGGRLGPAQYDVASLLWDPYVDLDWSLRRRLLDRYQELRDREGPWDRGQFRAGWPPVALCRLMQALGAYAFLTRRRGKEHFAPYAAPALAGLRRLLSRPPLAEYRALVRLLERLPRRPRLTPNPGQGAA